MIAEGNGDLIGYLELRIISDKGSTSTTLLRKIVDSFRKPSAPRFPRRRHGSIHDIYVQPHMRNSGLGVGFRLYKAGLRWFEQNDVHAIEGGVWVSNSAVLEICRKLGFETIRVLVRKKL